MDSGEAQNAKEGKFLKFEAPHNRETCLNPVESFISLLF